MQTGRYSPEAVEHEAEGVMENRLQNLAITIDKINIFLRHQPEAARKVLKPQITWFQPQCTSSAKVCSCRLQPSWQADP